MSDYTLAQLQGMATTDAQEAGINPSLFLAQIQQESGFNPNAVNGNAVGIAQFEPATAGSMGINPNDPQEALEGAAAYDAYLLAQNGNSYVAMLDKYGTTAVPSGGTLSASQQNLVTQAQALDSGQPYTGIPGTSLMSVVGNPAGTLSGIGSYLSSHALDFGMMLFGLIVIFGAIFISQKDNVAKIAELSAAA